jgi:hypothetical protein
MGSGHLLMVRPVGGVGLTASGAELWNPTLAKNARDGAPGMGGDQAFRFSAIVVSVVTARDGVQG